MDFMLIVFYLYVLKRVFWDGVKLRFSWHPGLWFFLIFFASVIISGITPLMEGNPEWVLQYFKSSSHFFLLALFPLFCCFYPIEIKNWSAVIKTWLILALAIDIFGIYQIIARAYDLPLAWIEYTNVSIISRFTDQFDDIQQLSIGYGNFFRATSIFSEPSALGGFNSIILAFLLAPIVNRYHHFINSKMFLILAVVFCLVSQLFTFSMTGFVGFFLFLIAVIYLEKVKILRKYIIYFAILISVIIFADTIFSKNLGVSVVELFSKRINGLIHWGDVEKEVPGESLGVRMLSGQKALQVWTEYPINGIGLGLTQYNKKYDVVFSDFTSFATLAELGIIGFIGLGGFFVALTFITYKFIKDKKLAVNLTEEERRNAGLMFYVMINEILINFISGNNLIAMALYIPISMVFSIVNSTNVKLCRHVVEISLVRKPLKELFAVGYSNLISSKRINE